MIKTIGILILSLLSTNLFSQQFTFNGTVTDSKTGEKLNGVSISVKGQLKGVVSENEGRFSIELSKGEHIIVFGLLGYIRLEKKIDLSQNETFDIELISKSESLNELLVRGEANDNNVTSTEMGVVKLSIQQIEKIPVIMGETDIFKTIQLLPGITNIAEGRSGFIVRGSGIDQNLILMDGMPLYYSSHMQGLYSIFNGDAVDGLTVYKGGIPARFGGRGASVLDVRMKESNFDNYKAKLSVGLITSKFSVEAPLIKDKLSVFLAGRSTKQSIGSLHDRIVNGKSNFDPTDKAAAAKSASVANTQNGYNFFGPLEYWYDLNGKVIYKPNEKNSIYLSGYYGQDNGITEGGLTDWGNRASLLRWSHQFNSKLVSNSSIIYSKYYTHSVNGIYEFNSGITTKGIKQEFSYFQNAKSEFVFGFQSEYQGFNHGALVDNTQSDGGKFMPPMQGLESAIFVENDRKVTSNISVLLGLRYSFYHRLGPGNSFTYDEVSNQAISSVPYTGNRDVMAFYHNPEPRLAITYLLNPKSSLKASYNRNAQYLRLMTLGSDITWYDIWMPSTENIRPMLTNQFAVGYFKNFLKNEIKFSVESYYKKLDGAADFEDGLHNYLINNLEAYVATGQGRAYGLEVSLEKPNGKFNGRISYNLGKSEYKIDVINKGRWYPNRFDVTNNLAVIASYDLIKGLTLSSTFIYSTGRPATLPEAYYRISGVAFPYWEGRNKYRLPDYHRLDFGIKYQPDYLIIKLKKAKRELTPSFELSFYNVYNRRNIHTINFTNAEAGKVANNGSAVFVPHGVSTFGFMPSFQFHLKF